MVTATKAAVRSPSGNAHSHSHYGICGTRYKCQSPRALPCGRSRAWALHTGTLTTRAAYPQFREGPLRRKPSSPPATDPRRARSFPNWPARPIPRSTLPSGTSQPKRHFHPLLPHAALLARAVQGHPARTSPAVPHAAPPDVQPEPGRGGRPPPLRASPSHPGRRPHCGSRASRAARRRHHGHGPAGQAAHHHAGAAGRHDGAGGRAG